MINVNWDWAVSLFAVRQENERLMHDVLQAGIANRTQSLGALRWRRATRRARGWTTSGLPPRPPRSPRRSPRSSHQARTWTYSTLTLMYSLCPLTIQRHRWAKPPRAPRESFTYRTLPYTETVYKLWRSRHQWCIECLSVVRYCENVNELNTKC